MTTALAPHRTTVTTFWFEDGSKQHTAQCVCGWSYVAAAKPHVEWQARLHRAIHNNTRSTP